MVQASPSAEVWSWKAVAYAVSHWSTTWAIDALVPRSTRSHCGSANADDQRKLFRSYNYPQDVKTKTRAVENAKLEVQKAQVQAENDLLAKKAEVQRIKNTIMRTQNNIKQYEDYIGKSTATAPT